jgi:lipopolysaccharide/colanic/teichoic acid biosynthesis glycosyltransferase
LRIECHLSHQFGEPLVAFLPTSRTNTRISIRVVDLVCAFAAPWLAFALRDPRFLAAPLINQAATYSLISVVVGLAILSWSGIGNIICRYLSAADHKRILLTAFTSVSITSMAAFCLTRLDTIPRTLPVIHFFLLGSLLIAGRLVHGLGQEDQIGRQTTRSKEDENIVVVGANHVASFYIRLIEQYALGRQRILAVVDPNPRLRNQTLAGHQIIGVPEDLPKILREYKTHGIEIHKLVVTMDESELSEGARECLCSASGADQQMETQFLIERLGLSKSSEVSTAPEAAPQPRVAGAVRMPLNHGYWKLKRTIDVIVAGSFLVVLAPVFALVALAVRLGVGSPVIFWQRRVGRLGKGIFVFKFRTMHAPFDAHGRLRDESEGTCRTGAFLRRTRLDELPQLFNILRGDMSLIGPRPLLPEDQPSDTGSRLLVLPGITGWAQVHGGNLISPEEKNALDEHYVRNASLWLDVKILFKTARFLLTGDRLPEKGGAAVTSGLSRPSPTGPAVHSGLAMRHSLAPVPRVLLSEIRSRAFWKG